VKLIKYIVSLQAHYVDKSMYDILDANLITEKKQFRKFSWEKNARKFYFEARIPVILMIFVCLVIIIYQTIINSYSWKFIGYYLSEAKWELSWPTTTIFSIPVINDWPSISKMPHFYFNNFEAWLSYLFFLIGGYAIIHFLVCTCAFLARNIRTITISEEYFKKDLNDLKKAKMASQGKVHNKKPSEEIKEYVNENGTK
jgi:hypothetical protein